MVLILASCYGRPIRRNSVLEELRVETLAVIQERMMKLSDAGVENGWIEREEKLCVVSMKVVVQEE